MRLHSIAQLCLPAVLAVFLLSSLGCDRSARSLSLDQSLAREACSRFLTAWQEGGQASQLKPDIIGRDYAWDAGQKLVAFEFLPGEFNDGTNLHIPVRLTFKDAQGKESRSEATYVVGTSPVVTVIRD